MKMKILLLVTYLLLAMVDLSLCQQTTKYPFGSSESTMDLEKLDIFNTQLQILTGKSFNSFYLCQEGISFMTIYLFVCLLAGLRKYCWLDLPEKMGLNKS